MALQGDLKSFALPDVLRLLAGAAKSGHLEVAGTTGSGEVVLCLGTIASASTDLSPHASDPSDVVYELLRLEDGSFAFDEGDVADTGWEADVDATIATAEALVDEWTAIEAVVPSMEAWVSLAAELEEAEVVVSADRWRVISAIGGGGNVHDLAAALELTDLAASRLVVDLAEAGLVAVRATHGYQPPRVELDDFDQFEEPIGEPMTDLHDLSAEDRPVVMEDREDALLPEPLPGEGVAYEGEIITGSVDGFGGAVDGFESFDPHPVDGRNEDFEQFESLADFEAEAAMSELIGEPGTIDGFGGADPFAPADSYEFDAATSAEEPPALEAVDEADVHEMPAAPAPASPVDEERDSLLKFLSSVKP
ncbi:MAG TPA: DUF4388 domain-containing protein [Acidimicrobiales bacterium]|nr:DUF4388 domain-containing protein [Acidimicrobiales bacterium]